MTPVQDPGPEEEELPPGQRFAKGFPIRHYGPIPKFRPDTWRLTIVGATADAQEHHLDLDRFAALPRNDVVGDLHCASKWTVKDNRWEGVLVSTLLDAVPPGQDVTHVMAWAEYGYSTNLLMEDFSAPTSILATHLNGAPLTPEHGWPLRLVVPHLYSWKGPKWLRMIEYLTAERRGYWEERGYHTEGNAMKEQRYSYMEELPRRR